MTNTKPEALGHRRHVRGQRGRVGAEGWICKVMPEGMNPRPDGRWDNPA